MDRVQTLEVFSRIVELGGFGKAADALKLPRATVSLAVQRLEARLGVQLLQRTTRRVRVTEEGERYYARCQQLLADLDDMDAEAHHDSQGPRGVLKVDMPAAFGCRWIVPHLPAFYRQYPHLQLDLAFNDRQVHLQREGVDCALRAGDAGDPGLARRPLAQVLQLTCASPVYLAQHGMPESPAALAQGHLMVKFPANNGRYFPLQFLHGTRLEELTLPGSLTVNNADAYVGAAIAGFGLVQVPHYHVQQALADGTLVQVLEAWPVPHWPIALVYPPHRHPSPRLRVFIDWVLAIMQAEIAAGAPMVA